MRTDYDVAVARGGPAFFQLVRFWSRRWAAAGVGVSGRCEDGRPGLAPVGHILLLEAVDAAGRGGPAQIAAVAVELGLDRSNASRMLASAVSAGLVVKSVSPTDARRAELEVTPAGADVLAAARAWQERMFAHLVADWPAADARRFASYLARLAAQPTREDQP
jgi:DNA-binding MarR family transcriptional regulator